MPLSAFAARQARRAARGEGETTQDEIPEESLPSQDNVQVAAASDRPPKRTRRQSERKRVRVERTESRDSSPAAASVEIITADGSEQRAGLDLDSALSYSDDAVPVDAPARQLCTVQSPSILADLGRKGFTVSLGVGETLAFSGLYILRVDKGAVRVLGATLKASEKAYQVFAPSTHCLPVIEHVQNPFGPSQPAEITVSSTEPEIQNLARLSTLFDNIWSADEQLGGRTFSFLHKSTDDALRRPLYPFEPPASWQSAALKLSDPAEVHQRKILVCGPKGAGKSTFARYLANALLSAPAVADPDSGGGAGISFLDLDPGQPEFSPPGDISLSTITSFTFGPPYTHPSTQPGSGNATARAHHLGSVTPRDDVAHYLDAAADLYAAAAKDRPLLVNTCGWIQGAGLDILEDLVSSIRPTDVVWMSRTGPAEAVAALSQRAKGCGAAMHLLGSQPAETPAARPAADLRAMQTMAYFHLDEPVLGTPYWRASPHLACDAQTIRWAGDDADIAGIMQLGNELDPAHLRAVVDGTVLGLVAVDPAAAPASALRATPDAFRLPYLFLGSGSCDPLPPSRSRALGQVLVAGVRARPPALLVHSPLDLRGIFEDARAAGSALVLVRGHLDAPGWFYGEARRAAAASGALAAEYAGRRVAEVVARGGKCDAAGVWGTDGEEWTRDEDWLAAAGDEGAAPWVQAVRRDGSGGGRERGDKVWRARRNLVVKDGSRRKG